MLATTGRIPQCIELFDTESRLRKFLRDYAEELRQVRAVLYRCELLSGAADLFRALPELTGAS
jgi:hypothetical protein